MTIRRANRGLSVSRVLELYFLNLRKSLITTHNTAQNEGPTAYAARCAGSQDSTAQRPECCVLVSRSPRRCGTASTARLCPALFPAAASPSPAGAAPPAGSSSPPLGSTSPREPVPAPSTHRKSATPPPPSGCRTPCTGGRTSARAPPVPLS